MVVNAGCIDEPGGVCRGLAHYLEHLILTGRNAEHADSANRQHYEVPAAFFDLVASRSNLARVATRDDAGEWTVHPWLKQAILLYFALRTNERSTSGPLEFNDKIPVKAPPPGVRA
jgi:predicted Zn-dependent peptidase